MFDEVSEYEARDDDGNVTSTIGVHVVTEDENDEYVNTTGGYQQVRTGNVLVANGRTYDVFGSVDDLQGYTAVEQPAPTPDEAPAEPADAPTQATDANPAGNEDVAPDEQTSAPESAPADASPEV